MGKNNSTRVKQNKTKPRNEQNMLFEESLSILAPEQSIYNCSPLVVAAEVVPDARQNVEQKLLNKITHH